MKKQWISVKCGLSRDPKHRQAMGESVWLYLHILDITSWDDGIAHDWKDEAAAEDMGMPVRTLREHRRRLAELGYITCNQKQYTQDIIVRNWTNPREYGGKVYNQGGSKPSPQDDTQDYIQGDTQGSTQDVTPTYSSNIKESNDILEKRKELAKASIEAAIFAGEEITPEMSDKWQTADLATKEFETALGFSNPLAWTKNKDWQAFQDWVIVRYSEDKECFKQYQAWRITPFVKGAIANTRLRGFVNEFYDSWDMFKMSLRDLRSPEVPLYKSLVEDTNVYVPNPNPRRR